MNNAQGKEAMSETLKEKMLEAMKVLQMKQSIEHPPNGGEPFSVMELHNENAAAAACAEVARKHAEQAVRLALETAAKKAGYIQHMGKAGYPVGAVDKQSILSLEKEILDQLQ